LLVGVALGEEALSLARFLLVAGLVGCVIGLKLIH
jgi:multidrug transporter EmrE-like cation transporter